MGSVTKILIREVKPNSFLVSQVGLFLLLNFVYVASADDIGSQCASIASTCESDDACCTQLCVANSCSDGLHRNSRDRAGGAPADLSQLIATELASGNNVDVSEHQNLNLLASLGECGESLNEPRRKKRIVGGTSYPLGKYPWAVSLHLNDITEESSSLHCGGSLISKRYVITASHCVSRLQAGAMLKWVTLGNVDRRIKLNCENETVASSEECNSKPYVDAEVENWIIHTDYSEAHVRHDIALIRLKHEVNYTNYIKPICLPRSEKSLKNWPDGRMTVIGWGSQTSDSGPQLISLKAQEVDMNLVHRSICNRFFSRVIGKLRKSQICVGGEQSKGDCAGDSGWWYIYDGSSLFKKVFNGNDKNSRERYFLFGIVSTGASTKCARQGKPSVFTNVIYYMPWILDNLVQNNNDVTNLLETNEAPVVINPVEEFKTGMEVNVKSHANAGLLPNNCGIIPGQQDHNGPATGAKEHPRKRVKRIVGGLVQSIGTFPFMAQIYVRNILTTDPVLRCGGFLISSRHVLTGAHCVGDIRGSYALDGVILGNFNRRDKIECIGNDCVEQKIIPIEEVIIHEGFTKFARENDIAIIKLSHDIRFNRLIQPICLPLSEDIVGKAWENPEKDRRYVAAGWGRVSGNSEETALSNFLVGANFTLENKRYCETVLVRKVGSLENSRVCGGGSQQISRSECIGDTGGPMMRWVKDTNSEGKTVSRMFAFGILSVVECAHQGVPSLYQNLLYYMPWIMDHLSD